MLDVAQVVKINDFVLEAFVGGIHAHEFLALVPIVEVSVVGQYRPGPEGVDVPFAALPEDLGAVEGAARVGPVERRDEPLLTVEQFLPAYAAPKLSIFSVQESGVGKEIQQIAAVLFDEAGLDVFVVADRVQPFDVEAEAFVAMKVGIQPSAMQEEGVVEPREAQPSHVVLTLEAQAILPADVQDGIIADLHPLELISQGVAAVAGIVEIAEVVGEEHALVGRGDLLFEGGALLFVAGILGVGLFRTAVVLSQRTAVPRRVAGELRIWKELILLD